MLRVTVLYFGPLRELVGRRSDVVELETGTRVSDLRRRLVEDHPGLEDRLPSTRWALDGEYVPEEAELRPGAEVALIPPVAGGSGVEPSVRVEIIGNPLPLGELRRWTAGPDLGASVEFLGVVRNHHQGRPVVRLEYQCYESMAERVIRRIAVGALERFGVARVAVAHRVGTLEIGDVALAVVATSPHRANTFTAVSWIVDQIKHDAPIWKHEFYSGGTSMWVECSHERQAG